MPPAARGSAPQSICLYSGISEFLCERAKEFDQIPETRKAELLQLRAYVRESLADSGADSAELLARIRERGRPFDVLERGLGGVGEDRRGPALLHLAELLLPLIEEDVKGSPAAFPTPDQVALMYVPQPLPKKIERAETRAWTNFKSGNQ